MDKPDAKTDQTQIRFISKKSPDYKLEFINGAISNVTPRGEIVCDFHFEFKDMPTEQAATIAVDGTVAFLGFQEINTVTRDVKFGIVMNPQFAKDLVKLLNDKIEGCDKLLARGEKGDRA